VGFEGLRYDLSTSKNVDRKICGFFVENLVLIVFSVKKVEESWGPRPGNPGGPGLGILGAQAWESWGPRPGNPGGPGLGILGAQAWE
jgi:hypothetical protein